MTKSSQTKVTKKQNEIPVYQKISNKLKKSLIDRVLRNQWREVRQNASC